MKRLFNIRTVLSLLLCIATVGLWVRSYWYEDLLAFPSPAEYSALQSAEGTVTVLWGNHIIDVPNPTFALDPR